MDAWFFVFKTAEPNGFNVFVATHMASLSREGLLKIAGEKIPIFIIFWKRTDLIRKYLIKKQNSEKLKLFLGNAKHPTTKEGKNRIWEQKILNINNKEHKLKQK